jgi:hypothetical protein
MVYDEKHHALVLFAGVRGPSGQRARISNETWVFDLDKETWTAARPSIRPASRARPALAYDSQSGLLVMIGGGEEPEAPILSSWLFDPAVMNWRVAERGPISREREQRDGITFGLLGPAVAYDAESDRTVLFGGTVLTGESYGWAGAESLNEEIVLDETWVFDADANTWDHRRPADSPAARGFHGMVYDPESDRILLWGGILEGTAGILTQNPPLDPDVWAYDYNTDTWTRHTNEDGPFPIGFDSPITFDVESDRMVVVKSAAEVWDYDYNTNIWVGQPPAPAQPVNTAYPALSYIGGDTDRIAVYGGCLEPVLFSFREYSDFNAQCSNELWFYDLNTNTLEKIGPLDS